MSLKLICADVAELADALVLGTSVFDVGVQVPSSAPIKINHSSAMVYFLHVPQLLKIDFKAILWYNYSVYTC